MFYTTGDTHGSFRPIKRFCAFNNLTKDDVLVILGDAAVNHSPFTTRQADDDPGARYSYNRFFCIFQYGFNAS